MAERSKAPGLGRLSSTFGRNQAHSGNENQAHSGRIQTWPTYRPKKIFLHKKKFFFTEQDFWENFSRQNFVSPENDKKCNLHQPDNTT